MRTLTFALGSLLCLLAVAPARAAGKPTVMVLYFDNNAAGPGYEGLAKGLADMMTTDLAAVPSVQVVERQKLDALLAELKLQRSKFFDAKTAQRLGKGAGAQYAVAGAFLSFEPTVRIDVRLIKIDSATVVKAASVTGHKNDFFKLQVELAAKLTEGLSEIVAAGDAQKVVASARKNRIDKLDSVLDYGKGIAARDQGDLSAASKHLQKVVSNEPAFALGQGRYGEIMKALYQSKDRREGLLSKDEATLLEHANAVFASTPPTETKSIVYRLVVGQLFLERVRKAVDQKQPWQDDMRKFFDNQSRLIEDTKDWPWYPSSRLASVDRDDDDRAENLGIKRPGNTESFHSHTPAAVMRETAQVLMTGSSMENVHLRLAGVPCPFTVHPAYGKAAIRWLEMALAHINEHENSYKVRETMRTTVQLATTLALLGRTEQGIAKLQAVLDAYPRAEEFDHTERVLRELLKGPPHTYCKTK